MTDQDVSASRFHSQGYTAEDLLKDRTIGLVQLSDFRKRQAEAIEEAERGHSPYTSGATTPNSRDRETEPAFKKKQKLGKVGKRGGGLSFVDDEDGSTDHDALSNRNSLAGKANVTSTEPDPATEESSVVTKRVKPSSTLAFKPKSMTKYALAREAQLKEQIRQEYIRLQEAVKATEIAIPFCFFDGRNAAGGICRVKKGDQVWLFLERARKLGADLAGKGDKSKKDWARISVDDLMLVREDLIIPHHYEFHYFILNRTRGYHRILFDYTSEPTDATPRALLVPKSTDGVDTSDTPPAEGDLMTAAQRKQQAAESLIPESELEGFDFDPSSTRVVDRRWYERNKHIYPASTWEEFDPAQDYTQGGGRKDAQGNAFFFSR